MPRSPLLLPLTVGSFRMLLTAVIVALCLPATARAQGTTDSLPTAPAAIAHKRHPALAATLGIIPGAGHAYAGEGRRGLAVLGGIVGVSLVMSLVTVAECVTDYSSNSSTDEACESGSADDVGSLMLLGIWGWSIVDAGMAANRTNRRAAEASKLAQLARVPLTLRLSQRPTASGDDSRTVNVGLRFNLR